MVGGRNFLENQFNRATDAMRQPGSVFKPFVYAAALNSAYDSGSRVFTAATVFKDEKKVFTFGQDSYSPNNFGDTFTNKETTLRDALVKSKNVITVDLAMQVNIGRVMNLAHKAGLPKVEKAYPSMALGTAEATPLNVATAYTMFANLGDSVAPMPITRVTRGDGQTVAAPQPERKNVIRPDVAYIMDDILKDVINRGTAAQAQGWGFRNVAGKTGFAGKTGTSRDGWFAGFTPELVTVVYVGFDDGDDLGMKGADSAMPIWADFMQEALRLHPEWNGDWPMPATVRKAEIDIRTGSLIRELDALASDEPKKETATPTPSPTPASQLDPETEAAWKTEDLPEPKAEFVTNVPAEFRRVELFIGGTIPNRQMVSTDAPLEYPDDQSAPPPEGTAPTPTPLSGTWQDKAEPPPGNRSSARSDSGRNMVSVMVCPITGLRATENCPVREARSFARGTEPEGFCYLHR
jgi:penicillin-binding protein 1B